MWKAFWAVVQDLWDFVLGRPSHTLPAAQPTPHTPAATTPANQADDVMTTGQQVYVAVPSARCYRDFSGTTELVAAFSYGQVLTVEDARGDYLRVRTPQKQGWVSGEEVVDDPNTVFPQFASGQFYSSADGATRQLRLFLKDQFLADQHKLPVQAAEYVLYRLARQGLSLPVPTGREYLSQSWQTLLRGSAGVHIGIEPKTNAVLEVARQRAASMLAYVEAVHPDESLTLCSFGREKAGVYQVDTVAKAEWKEWRPVFISLR